MTIYERIKARRIELGLSQDELAKEVGYNGRYVISKVEAGSRDIKASMVEKYAEALHVSKAWLLTGEEKTPDSDESDAVKDIMDRFNRLSPENRNKFLAEIIKSLSSH